MSHSLSTLRAMSMHSRANITEVQNPVTRRHRVNLRGHAGLRVPPGLTVNFHVIPARAVLQSIQVQEL